MEDYTILARIYLNLNDEKTEAAFLEAHPQFSQSLEGKNVIFECKCRNYLKLFCVDRWTEACIRGELEIVKWLHENRTVGCSKSAMDWAADCGQLDVVKWLHENRTEGCTTDAMDWAAMNGHLNIVKWLHENRAEGCTKRAMNSAAQTGNLKMVKWLYENRTEGCAKNALFVAEMFNQRRVIDFLEKKDPVLN